MRTRAFIAAMLLAAFSLSGCAAIPDIHHQPQFHNPFPQLQRVAVLPFANQSQEPTLDTDRVTIAYHNELQKLPGFEVKPLGVVKAHLAALQVELDGGLDLQALAQHLEVDAIIVGAVTEYQPYYPPRIGMRVHWYAANPGFHPIPPGYGLPWGTPAEGAIPDRVVHEAEFALAQEQLKTQTPDYVKRKLPTTAPLPPPNAPSPENDVSPDSPPLPPQPTDGEQGDEPRLIDPLNPSERDLSRRRGIQVTYQQDAREGNVPQELVPTPRGDSEPAWTGAAGLTAPSLPADWPSPRGLIPEGPRPEKPPLIPQAEPIITHTRLFDGHDEQFTQQLAEYFRFRDDARFGGWQAYLQRSDDFISFCCHLHVTETLAARGGAGKSRVVWRWPIDRYER